MGKIRSGWKLTTRYYDDGRVITRKAVRTDTAIDLNNPWDSKYRKSYTEYNDYFGSETSVNTMIHDFEREYKDLFCLVDSFADMEKESCNFALRNKCGLGLS